MTLAMLDRPLQVYCSDVEKDIYCKQGPYGQVMRLQLRIQSKR
jgi:hypothetical protein